MLFLNSTPGGSAAHSVLRRRGRRASSPSPVKSPCLPIRTGKIRCVSPSSAPASLAHPPLSVSASSPSHLLASLSPFYESDVGVGGRAKSISSPENRRAVVEARATHFFTDDWCIMAAMNNVGLKGERLESFGSAEGCGHVEWRRA